MELDHKKDLNTKLLSEEDPHSGSPTSNNGTVPKDLPWWKCCAKLNNKTVLFIVCCLFACFASAEMAGAFVGSSLALLGDATASCVDVITYFTNLYAETIATPKTPVPSVDDLESLDYKKNTTSAADKTALDERTRLFHEVYVPTFSCLALISVTIFIMIVASIEISGGGDDSADANVMFAFASVNAVIDIICITMFYYRKDDIVHNKFPSFSAEPVHTPNVPVSLHSVNINMFSAFTHIGSDTLRTIAVFAAAIVSSTTGAKSSICDAWAALVVSITIFFALIPLATEVYAAFKGKR